MAWQTVLLKEPEEGAWNARVRVSTDGTHELIGYDASGDLEVSILDLALRATERVHSDGCTAIRSECYQDCDCGSRRIGDEIRKIQENFRG